MAIERNAVDGTKFNKEPVLPYELRLKDFELGMQDVYDFYYDVNTGLVAKGLERLDDFLRPYFDPDNCVKAGTEGVEIKTTRKSGGAVDTHGARDQWMCVFVYEVDNESEPVVARAPLTFTEVYLAQVAVDDFRKNARGDLGTRTATLHRDGMVKLRKNWIYRR